MLIFPLCVPPAVLQVNPLQTHAHAMEGFAVDWSRVKAGRLATGDCKKHIHVWEPQEAGRWQVGRGAGASCSGPLAGHRLWCCMTTSSSHAMPCHAGACDAGCDDAAVVLDTVLVQQPVWFDFFLLQQPALRCVQVWSTHGMSKVILLSAVVAAICWLMVLPWACCCCCC